MWNQFRVLGWGLILLLDSTLVKDDHGGDAQTVI